MNYDKLIKANTNLLDEKKALEYDVVLLTKIIEKAKKYAEINGLKDLLKILCDEDED